MASAWDHFGQMANMAQLAGFDAIRLISMIAQAANTARMHKKNCRQFAQHLKLIGNLLASLNMSGLKKYRETREPLEQLEDALRRSYLLVNSCQDRSYLYLLAMGWNIVYQFRRAQNEIDQYLKLVPLITLVDNARVQDTLQHIDKDQREYTLDDEDEKVQSLIMNPETCTATALVLKKTLSTSYPNLCFKEALRQESQKLQLELQLSQANLDVGQCQVIQRLIHVTETVAAATPVPSSPESNKLVERVDSQVNSSYEEEEDYSKKTTTDSTHKMSRKTWLISSSRDLLSTRSSYGYDEWHTDLLGCCAEPLICAKTFLYPCGTISRISSVANNRDVSSGEACNDLMAYSLILSCCCYTCCLRGKLRKMLNIKGGWFDDFLSHLMCCCCALVQEWREVEIRGSDQTTTIPPRSQYMES